MNEGNQFDKDGQFLQSGVRAENEFKLSRKVIVAGCVKIAICCLKCLSPKTSVTCTAKCCAAKV